MYATGFRISSKIQSTTLPLLLVQPFQNLLAQSQSDTGKTIASVVMMLTRVDINSNYRQNSCEVLDLSRNITYHIIIGTPEKVLDGSLKTKLIDLKKIRIFIFILDEAEIIISEGHGYVTIGIHKALSYTCQMLFFSATYDKDIRNFARFTIDEANIIRFSREQEPLNNI
uniref:Helicase ATP-binding domain-containing protein n=1 Tax=Glossina brevipalpis TaxID=37001 RepID=A0A1A9X5N6_9MUSC